MVVHMPTRMIVLILVALILLAIGLMAIAQASGLTIPVFDQISELLGGLKIAE